MCQSSLFPEGEVNASLSQWYTHPGLAERMVRWAFVLPAWCRAVRRVLEPSAGVGNIIWPILDHDRQVEVEAWEIDEKNCQAMLQRNPRRTTIHHENFLNADLGNERFDLAVMNPPFENDQDVQFIMKAASHCDRVVSIVRGVLRHGQNRWSCFWRYIDIVREVVLIERPKFGGAYNPMQDFLIVEFKLAKVPRNRGQATTGHSIEWW